VALAGGEETWAEQRRLSDVHRLLLIDRRGFGDSPPAEGEAVVSLTVIEPPAFSLTRGTDASDDLVARLHAVFGSQSTMGPERFWIAFLEAFGRR
jgi:pimeloyl-ACP methyl ester carboxylesterase